MIARDAALQLAHAERDAALREVAALRAQLTQAQQDPAALLASAVELERRREELEHAVREPPRPPRPPPPLY